MGTKLAAFVGAALTLSTVSASQAPARAAEGQWLIERVGGSWEVRESGRSPRAISGKYDVLTAGSQVRCLKLPCTLDYSTDGGAARPVFTKPQVLNQWIKVPQPTQQPVAPMAKEMLGIIGQVGVRGGANKDLTVCGGQLPLVSPKCHEVIDPDSFRLVWTLRPTEAGRQLTLFVGNADALERRRWSVSADALEFDRPDLREYLRTLQVHDRPLSVVFRLMRTETVDAARMVRLISRAEHTAFKAKVNSYGRLADLPRQLKTLEEALKLEMWSRAADIALALEQGAPTSLEIRKYALIGLCGSDYAFDIARLRSSLRDAGVRGICDPDGIRP